MGYLETLQQGLIKSGKPTQQTYEIMSQHTKRLVAQVEDMSVLAELQGQEMPATNSISLRACVEEAVKQLHSSLTTKQITLQLQLPPEGATILASRYCVHLLISHLLKHLCWHAPKTRTHSFLKAETGSRSWQIQLNHSSDILSIQRLAHALDDACVISSRYGELHSFHGLNLVVVRKILQLLHGQISYL
jgi:hypothetical protein